LRNVIDWADDLTFEVQANEHNDFCYNPWPHHNKKSGQHPKQDVVLKWQQQDTWGQQGDARLAAKVLFLHHCVQGSSTDTLTQSASQMDRYIPSRTAIDLEIANLHLCGGGGGMGSCKENAAGEDDDTTGSSAYHQALAGQLLTGGDATGPSAAVSSGNCGVAGRILAFKHKAPAPPEGHEGSAALRALYSDNASSSAASGPGGLSRKHFRHIPQTQERILDAPDLVDDYYLNLIDWGTANNTIAVALGRAVFLWNASSGVISELCSMAAEDAYISSVSWAEDGTYLAVGTSDARVQIYDAQRGKQVRSRKCTVAVGNSIPSINSSEGCSL
jgi:cell division cycle 20, cofactor of APC complex